MVKFEKRIKSETKKKLNKIHRRHESPIMIGSINDLVKNGLLKMPPRNKIILPVLEAP